MTHHHMEMLGADFQRTPGRREDQPEGAPSEADPRKSAAANSKVDKAKSIDGSGASDAVTVPNERKRREAETRDAESRRLFGKSHAEVRATLDKVEEEKRTAAARAKKRTRSN